MKAQLISCALLFSACAASRAVEAPPKAEAPAEAPGPSDLERLAAEQSAVERIYQLAPPEKQPSLGNPEAKVKLEVCSDFQCPFCARLVPTLHELVENYGEFVRVVWRNCPLPFHEHALPAAEAALEVFTQAGDQAFWAYHNQLFEHQQSLDRDGLVKLASNIEGVNANEVRAALLDHRHAPHIQKELQGLVDSGAASGGFGTPATFVNGRLISGAQPYPAFEAAVERALQESPEARAEAEAQSLLAFPMARARHILIQYAGAEGAEDKVTRNKEDAEKLARALHQRITQQNADMAQLARDNSDCPSAPDGGELGRFTRGELVPQFEQALFSLEPGQTSGVVETPFGYHVIRREE